MDEATKAQLRSNYRAAMKAAERIPLSEIRSGPIIDRIGGCRVIADGEQVLIVAMRGGDGAFVFEINPIAAAMLAKDLHVAASKSLPDEVRVIHPPDVPDTVQ